MRLHGTLIKWNDDRGFGFVALPQTHEEVFVHISAFPRDGVRPRVGETISFEIGGGPDGRKRAERVQRPGNVSTAPAKPRLPSRSRRNGSLSRVVTLGVLAAIGIAGYLFQRPDRATPSPMLSMPQEVEARGRSFRCDGRTHCSQMTSCEEARYFLRQCPGTQMDGDADGEPCEDQWCN